MTETIDDKKLYQGLDKEFFIWWIIGLAFLGATVGWFQVENMDYYSRYYSRDPEFYTFLLGFLFSSSIPITIVIAFRLKFLGINMWLAIVTLIPGIWIVATIILISMNDTEGKIRQLERRQKSKNKEAEQTARLEVLTQQLKNQEKKADYEIRIKDEAND